MQVCVLHLDKQPFCFRHKHNNLISRVKETCITVLNEISFLRYLFDDSYVFKCKKKLTNFRCDGIIASRYMNLQKNIPIMV